MLVNDVNGVRVSIYANGYVGGAKGMCVDRVCVLIGRVC